MIDLEAKHQYFPLVDKVSFEGISLSTEESVSQEAVTGRPYLSLLSPPLLGLSATIALSVFEFTSDPQFPTRKESGRKQTLGVAGLLGVLLRFLDYFSHYVNFRECTAGGTRARINRDNFENIPILLHRHDSFSTSNMTPVRCSTSTWCENYVARAVTSGACWYKDKRT